MDTFRSSCGGRVDGGLANSQGKSRNVEFTTVSEATEGKIFLDRVGFNLLRHVRV